MDGCVDACCRGECRYEGEQPVELHGVCLCVWWRLVVKSVEVGRKGRGRMDGGGGVGVRYNVVTADGKGSPSLSSSSLAPSSRSRLSACVSVHLVHRDASSGSGVAASPRLPAEHTRKHRRRGPRRRAPDCPHRPNAKRHQRPKPPHAGLHPHPRPSYGHRPPPRRTQFGAERASERACS